MSRYPTLEQFSAHPCEHWQMREAGEWCVMFDKALSSPQLHCDPRCPEYDSWDCEIEELLTSESEPR